MRRRHPALRAAIALTVLAIAFPAVAGVLAAVLGFVGHHVVLIVAVFAVRLLAGLVPGLHSLLSALVGYRLTRLLIGEPR